MPLQEASGAYQGKSVLGSVTDPRQVRMVLNAHGGLVVLHVAAYEHMPLPGLTNNVFGTRTLARAAARQVIRRWVEGYCPPSAGSGTGGG